MNEDFDALVITQATKNSGNLEVAFKTHKLWQDILNQLVASFFVELNMQLSSTLLKIGEGWTVELSKPGNMKTAMNIHLSNPQWQNIVFGIGDYDGDRVHFFIKSQAENRMELYQYVADRINGKANPDIWYQRAILPYNTWDLTFEGLMALHQPKQFVDYCTGKLTEISTIINEYLHRS